MNNIPLSLYIHIPWCIQKCPYCDFNSHQLKSDDKQLENNYIDALIVDLQQDIIRFSETRPLQSIFIGGGTPSLFSGDSIKRLLREIRQKISFSPDIEITIEANPGSVDSQHFKHYYQAGINRISIGIQSFNNSQLQQLGRIHNSSEAKRAVKIAQDVGFDNINIDLMFGLPQQTISQAISDIEQGIALGSEHLSYYQLTIEPNTAFAHKPPIIPCDESIIDITEQTYPVLQQAGFERYEVSAWTRNRPAKHNINYWQYGDYLGIGAGAHAKITCWQNNQQVIIRSIKNKHPKQYLSGEKLQSLRNVKESEKVFEFMLNTMRLRNGFSPNLIQQRGLFNPLIIEKTLNELTNKQLLTFDREKITPTDKGYLFLNNMLEAFL